jgi:iron(III) transport system permease protein
MSLGRTRAQTFRRVIVPQLRPAAAAGGLLVALYTLHDFGAVSLLRFDSFTRAIYVSYRGSFDRSRAAVLALVLVAMALVVVVAEFRTRSKGVIYRVHGGGSRMPAITPLGRWRWPALGACVALVATALVMPMSVIGYWVVRSARGGGPIADTIRAGINSLEVAALAALVAAAAAWPVAFLAARSPGRLSRSIERATYIGYAVPGIVVALALVFFGARYAPAIYQTLPLLVFAYVVLFLPQATGAIRASLEQVNPALEDAARSLGAPAGRVARTILFPLVRPGIAAGLALVFLTVMKELPATLLLAPTGFRTLATEVWNSTSAAFFDRAAAPALALILLSSVPLAVVMLRDREAR